MSHLEPQQVQAILTDWKSAEVSPRIATALQLLEALTLHPQELDATSFKQLNQAKLSTAELQEVAAVAFHFNFINRVADAMDFPVPDSQQVQRQGRVLNMMARVASGGSAPQPAFVIGERNIVRPAELQTARIALLDHKGAIDGPLRTDIEAYAASLWGADRPPHNLPEVVLDFVKRLSLHAFTITTEIDDLKAAGYDDQHIFEMTLLGAFGAALAAQEKLSHLFSK